MLMDKRIEMNACKTFGELFSELENCDEEDQAQKIEEMIGPMDDMDREESILF
ncbi:uncharacterized protein MONOS_18683 [Monocercomonoides exilis]|uniref:uncharacterized protein n=1 Tax=Monocercomonoides exilis TaxID=2049356 RepID=UPI003559426B|nr:hypothetical protein MONOS_18683 [Monocercomonoides exilis]